MRRIYLFFIILFVFIATATPPQIVSSTYQIKKTHLLGIDYEHAILEFNVDDDVYYSESWPCSCITAKSQCNIVQNITISEPLGIITLQENLWYNVRSQSLHDKSVLRN